MFRGVLLGLIASAIVIISLHHASTEAGECTARRPGLVNFEPTRPPRTMPDTPFVDADGATRTLADYRGQGVVLNFWATWCAPCVREMPSLDRLKEELSGDRITVLAVSEDRKGRREVERFFRREGIRNLDVLLDKRGRLMRRLGVPGLPTTILIDADGDEIGRVLGAAEWDAPGAVTHVRDCLRPPIAKRAG
jgi:thiol-disulfide isomerase/thioredoxin